MKLKSIKGIIYNVGSSPIFIKLLSLQKLKQVEFGKYLTNFANLLMLDQIHPHKNAKRNNYEPVCTVYL